MTNRQTDLELLDVLGLLLEMPMKFLEFLNSFVGFADLEDFLVQLFLKSFPKLMIPHPFIVTLLQPLLVLFRSLAVGLRDFLLGIFGALDVPVCHTQCILVIHDFTLELLEPVTALRVLLDRFLQFLPAFLIPLLETLAPTRDQGILLRPAQDMSMQYTRAHIHKCVKPHRMMDASKKPKGGRRM